MSHVMRRSFLMGLVLVLLGGCSRDTAVSPRPGDDGENPTLTTRVGPVEVFSYREREDGAREVLLHQVRPDGRHVLRTLEVRTGEDPGGGTTNRYRLLDRDSPVAVLEQRAPGDGEERIETEIACGGERITWSARRNGNLMDYRAVHRKGDLVSEVSRRVDPLRLGDPDYLASLRRAFAAMAPSGPLRSSPDLLLLTAVLESEDWVGILGASDSDVEEKFRRTCVVSTTLSKLSCLAARFLPAAWVVCIPSSGISLACLMYQVLREFVIPDPDPCRCPCMCPPRN